MRKFLNIRGQGNNATLVRSSKARESARRRTATLAEAYDRFMDNCVLRCLKLETLRRYQLMGRELKVRFGKHRLHRISAEKLSRYRRSWKLAPITSRKKMEQLRVFFNFCVEHGWMEKNPARLLKPPTLTFAPPRPFTSEELEGIRDAVEIYPDRPKGRRQQVKAFVLLLECTGLRITDALCLTQNKIADGKLLLYTAKPGQPVWIPLAAEVLRELEPLPFRPFWSGNCIPKSAAADWQRTLARLFKIAGIEGHAHRYRDTFAVNLLQHGVSLENVAVLLGHADIKITQKDYAPWVKTRQAELETAIKRAWELSKN